MNVIFVNKKEEEIYNHYLQVRGMAVYKMVYDALCLLTGDNNVLASDLMGVIKYDKRLRDTIYTYLGTIEEYILTTICKFLDYTGMDEINDKDTSWRTNIIKTENYGYNLYKFWNASLSRMISIIEKYHILFDSYTGINILKDLNQIRMFRNKIMHHHFITIDPLSNDSKKAIYDRIKYIEQCVKSMVHLLPNDWKQGFINNIKKCNNQKNIFLSQYIKLEV